ncbi:sialate O-acetylesterase-like [Pomacea canaliculata]|nr:sialate O-acetylesterase-like [Pomacea canaliculata]
MEFPMNQVNNSEDEQQRALAFSTIRVFLTAFAKSDSPLDTVSTWHPWGPPTSGGIGGLSAVCWLFGEYLQPHLNYPIGLVQTSRGGTSIEAWSPPEAISVCPSNPFNNEPECCPQRPLVLWNAMIHPFLNMTIFGAIWYQGETNVGYPEAYSCQMKQLVKQWRDMFHNGSVGETSLDFPFGYVQLSALNPPNATQWDAYPDLRWAQTVGHGYSPNPDLPYTFMAVAMDLPDFSSPYGAVHTRFKQDVSRRLVLGALHVAYGRSDVTFQGPFPTLFTNDASQRALIVQYDYGRTPLDIRATNGFQICCASSSDPCDSHGPRWMEVPITKHGNSDVTLSIAGCSQRVMGLRYAWRDSPCELKKCAIYAADSGLPAPPYMTKTPVT